jgi:ABC-type transport system involved in cytochrome c biogenesis permease subunit
MEIKYTIQGLLIYLTIAAYLLAFVITVVAGRRKAGHTLFLAAFLLAVVSYLYRWYDSGHVPLQNLFEVFLFLGVACYPISWFCRRFLRIGGQWTDILIGVIVLFPAGFVFHAQTMQLPPALQSWLFVPHVAVYMVSYVFMFKAMFQAFEELLVKPKLDAAWLPPEQATYELIAIGFPLLTLGLVLGSWWGKLAWGDYWGWDPKELWSLASWLVYLGYFHWRYMFGKKRPHSNSLWAIAGMIAIIITLLWVNLSRLFPGLHSYAT